MIGVFDSGVGGLCAFTELRRLLPREDIIYLADRKNAPYGTKSRDELIALTKKDIRILRGMGAERILIACCTASTVHQYLDENEREISLPIIAPASRLASRHSSVYVIATRHTAESGAFAEAIGRYSHSHVIESAEQELVSLVERGSRDGRLSLRCEALLDRISAEVRESGAEALVLGCTHFSHLSGELQKRLPEVEIISPARVGADVLYNKIKDKRTENGRNIYLAETKG